MPLEADKTKSYFVRQDNEIRIEGRWELMVLAEDMKARGIPWGPGGPFTLLTKVDFEVNDDWCVMFGNVEIPAGTVVRECYGIKLCRGACSRCSRYQLPFIRVLPITELGLCFLFPEQPKPEI